jgi:tetratricopeptide (TPR) repeat protein
MLESPTFFNEATSRWREDIQATWTYLDRKCHVKTSFPCLITINPGRGWTLAELKRIAQAVIYFESALEILMPHYLGALDCKRLWRDNPRLANLSRSRAIAHIASTSTISEFAELTQSARESEDHFFSVFEIERSTENLELLYPGAATATEAIGCIESALSFVRGCVSNRPLTQFPPTQVGLFQFMSGIREREDGPSSGPSQNESNRRRRV